METWKPPEINPLNFIEDILNGNFNVIDLPTLIIVTVLSALILAINNNE